MTRARKAAPQPSPGLVGRDLSLRYVDRDGKTYTQQHRVWDADRFVAAQQQRARDQMAVELKANPRDKRPPYRVEVA